MEEEKWDKILTSEEFSNFKEALINSNISISALIFLRYAPDNVKTSYDKLLKKYPLITKAELLFKLKGVYTPDATKPSIEELWEIAAERKEGIVFEKYPELNRLLQQTKDKTLYKLTHPGRFNRNGFQYKSDFLIFPQILYENVPFIKWIRDNWNGQYQLSMAFEPDMLGIANTEHEYIMKSFWYGPKTLDNIKKEKKKNHLTVLGAYAKPWEEQISDRTEFYFKKQLSEWALEIEELLPLENGFFSTHTRVGGERKNYFTRYIHAILNDDFTLCRHIDGAIRIYDTKDRFLNRNKMTRFPMARDISTRYKLFKIESEEGLTNYGEIIGAFFSYNPYVLEFFDKSDDNTKNMEDERIERLRIQSEFSGLLE